MKTVNSYLIRGEYNTLIDSGENTDATWDALQEKLKTHGLAVSDIDKIVITHAHVDHIGMAKRVSEESQAKVHVSELVYPWAIKLNEEWSRRSEVMKRTFERHLSEEQKRNFMPIFKSIFGKVSEMWETLMEDQVEIFDYKNVIDLSGKAYECIHCPGHTWTQTCFLHEDGDFFSADMLLKLTPTCVIEADPNNPTQRNKSMPQLIASFENLLDKPIKTIFPGHYEEMDDHIRLITRQLDRIQMRKNQVHDLIKGGTNTFLDLFNTLYKGSFNFPGLVMALGYLDLLIEESRIKEEVTNDGIVFIPLN
jgi:glyoxylase-like metal-dependent hydrolase (beta-lactamase superfamily II)